MSSVAISGNASGAGVLTIAAPNTASSYTLTLPTATTTLVGTDATQTLTNKTIDASQLVAASVTTTQLATAVQPVGVGQTWQNLSASRAAATTYTNSSGRPITVFIMGGSSASNSVIIGGLTTQTFAAFVPVTFIVPNGDTYRIASVNSGVFWLELR